MIFSMLPIHFLKCLTLFVIIIHALGAGNLTCLKACENADDDIHLHYHDVKVTLPAEVFKLIFSNPHLSLKDLSNAACVCWSWKKTSEDNSIWKPRISTYFKFDESLYSYSSTFSILKMSCPSSYWKHSWLKREIISNELLNVLTTPLDQNTTERILVASELLGNNIDNVSNYLDSHQDKSQAIIRLKELGSVTALAHEVTPLLSIILPTYSETFSDRIDRLNKRLENLNSSEVDPS